MFLRSDLNLLLLSNALFMKDGKWLLLLIPILRIPFLYNDKFDIGWWKFVICLAFLLCISELNMYWSWFVITKCKRENIYWDGRVRILRFLINSDLNLYSLNLQILLQFFSAI